MSEELEIHLTLGAGLDAERVRAIAARHGLATTYVVLSGGAVPDQPLLTRRAHLLVGAAQAQASALCVALAEDAVEVVRVKIERDLRRARAALDVDAGYLEHHVKVRVATPMLAALESLARARGAHLSRNAFAVAGPGQELRFLTQRFASDEHERADRELVALRAALDDAPWCDVVDVEREHVVFDSNLALDAGWSTEPDGRLSR